MSWFMFQLGGFLGWVTHPLIWIVFSPQRWALYLGVTGAQESGGDPNIAGDLDLPEASVGIAQFQPETWMALTSWPTSDRVDPFKSGYVSAAYVQAALLVDWAWLPALSIPIWGMGAMRRLWKAGIASGDKAFSWKDTGATAFAGNYVWPTYLRWVVPAVLVSIVAIFFLWSLKKRPVVT